MNNTNYKDIEPINKYPIDFETYENLSKTFYFSINVYYQNLKYTLISEQPKIELFGFISNSGGILGLFLGLIEVLAELVYIKFQ